MKLVLPAAIGSLQDLQSVTLELKAYAIWQAHEQVKQRGGSGATPAPALTVAASELVEQAGGGGGELTAQKLEELVDVLVKLPKTAPHLHITLAAIPSPGFKQKIVAWCRTNLGPDTLVSFQFNSGILGGMVVRSGSRIFDWSFRSRIIGGRGRFREVLNRV